MSASNLELEPSSSKVPLTIPEFNSDDKLEQANKLINTLAKRKKISIILSMLLFFQEKNFPKMIKDYLIEGVKDYIQMNPGRVISYNGDPFTRDNCIRGMSVVIGKHRVIQKEIIDGVEYLHVNLVQASIFLSDEISKICQGPRGNRPIHCSLVDEPKYEFKKGKIGLEIGLDKNQEEEKGIENVEQNHGGDVGGGEEENEDAISNSKLNLDMRDDDEFSAGQEEKILNNPSNIRGHIISLESEEGAEGDNFARPDNIYKNNNLSKGGNLENNENSMNNNEDNLVDNNEISESKIEDINNFGDAPNSIGGNLSNLNFDKILDNKPRNKKKEKSKNGLELPKSKYPFQDIVSVKNIGKFSQVNNFLRENKDSILKYLELFKTMQRIGKEGMKNLERLESINPTNKEDESKSQISKEEKEENTEADMEEIFSEFEIKKENLIRVYKRIQTTVGSIYSLGDKPDLNFIQDDINYLDSNSKIFNQILEDMFPLFDKINAQTQHYSIAKIIKNLQRISDTLKDNDIGFKNFFVFVQSMINRIPMGAIRGNSLCDILGEEVEDINERKKQYLDILVKEKDSLIKAIEPILKKIEESKNPKKEEKEKVEENKEDVIMKDEEKTDTEKEKININNDNDNNDKKKTIEVMQTE